MIQSSIDDGIGPRIMLDEEVGEGTERFSWEREKFRGEERERERVSWKEICNTQFITISVYILAYLYYYVMY